MKSLGLLTPQHGGWREITLVKIAFIESCLVGLRNIHVCTGIKKLTVNTRIRSDDAWMVIDLILKRRQTCSLSLPRNTKQCLELPEFYTEQDKVKIPITIITYPKGQFPSGNDRYITDHVDHYHLNVEQLKAREKCCKVTRHNHWWFATCEIWSIK